MFALSNMGRYANKPNKKHKKLKSDFTYETFYKNPKYHIVADNQP
jgi:hypothetical protein